MPIALSCPGCARNMNMPDNTAGKKAKCNVCGTMFEIPLPVEGELELEQQVQSPQAGKKPIPVIKPVSQPQTATIKFCPVCGQSWQAGAIFCSQCAWDSRTDQAREKKTPTISASNTSNPSNASNWSPPWMRDNSPTSTPSKSPLWVRSILFLGKLILAIVLVVGGIVVLVAYDQREKARIKEEEQRNAEIEKNRLEAEKLQQERIESQAAFKMLDAMADDMHRISNGHITKVNAVIIVTSVLRVYGENEGPKIINSVAFAAASDRNYDLGSRIVDSDLQFLIIYISTRKGSYTDNSLTNIEAEDCMKANKAVHQFKDKK